MTAIRILLVLLGVWLAGLGLTDLLRMNGTDLLSIVFWFAGGILVHDAVFAPLCAALGSAGRRRLPRRAWAPLACGAVCTVTLIAIAVPVLVPGGANADNPTIRDRPYLLGLTIAVVTVWALVALSRVGSHLTHRSESH
ncbi:hypothetical protein JK358_20930 [Nocardia sp. 2]|uniref:Uncharacterized protein n=1 Tax=Nocardia acididurans TaxID=2802282 RepID=A0ABS1M889_9NOCA|nr:hypothetical protein [Nocardia acididurans]MBL1076863.1 hypothetical protein [Nocardia acididurans]